MITEKYNVSGMTCAACQANITRVVGKLNGVSEVNVSLLANKMTVAYEEDQVTSDQIIQAVTKIGYGASLAQIHGNPSSQNNRGNVIAENASDGNISAGDPVSAGTSVPSAPVGNSGGFEQEWQNRKDRALREQEQMRKRLISSIILLIPLMYIAMGHMMGLPVPSIFTGTENALINALTQLLIATPVLLINSHFFRNGFKALIMRAPNMDSLVAVGSSASYIYGIFAIYRMAYGFGHGNMELVHQYAHELYFESAAMILTLVTVGKYLEARSKSKTSDALGKLVDLAPKTATVIRNDQEITLPADQVTAGDIVVIRPGEIIPVDGVILDGNGYLDQAAITGESIPVEKGPGDTVISATINKNGSFRFRASRVGDDTTLAQIIRLVDEAGNTKAPIARLADKVSGIFVPTVIVIAIVTALVWIAAGQDFEFALSSAIAVLVISCPCALGLATPVAIMVGTGKAAEYGILIKSAESLENLHSVDTIVLDKTGTITSGTPSVTDIILFSNQYDEKTFLAHAAAAESGSEHPLAQAVLDKAKELNLQLPAASNFLATAGRGIQAEINGEFWNAGNLAYIESFLASNNTKRNISATVSEETLQNARDTLNKLAMQGKTPLLFAKENSLIGIIAVADTVRDSSAAAIRAFLDMGLHVVMLTGDNHMTAEAIRAQLGIEEAISDVLPTEKEACIRRLQEKGAKVAMVGDGINDAPALTRADIGIAIGAGTDIAVESADVVLMKDSLYDVVTAIRLSHSVIRNIRMNLFWAFFYNILGIPVAAGALFPMFGIRLSPMFGSAAMSLSSVCVVTNALRLRFFKAEPESEQPKSNIDCQEQSEMKGDFYMKKTLIVEGMMCMHCQAHVQKALAGVDGVASAVVDLEKKEAVVELSADVADQVLIDAVTEAGYSVVSCI